MITHEQMHLAHCRPSLPNHVSQVSEKQTKWSKSTYPYTSHALSRINPQVLSHA